MFLWIKHKLDGETRHRCNTIIFLKKNLLISCYVPYVSWHFILFVCHRYMKNVTTSISAFSNDEALTQCLEATLGLARASNKLRTISTLLGFPRLNATAESNGVIPKPCSGGLGSQRSSKSFCKVSRLARPATSVS